MNENCFLLYISSRFAAKGYVTLKVSPINFIASDCMRGNEIFSSMNVGTQK
ncbi:hypothetical protein B4070_4441 [Bacillus subtilis]|nr:hypothetical protein B4070_4441 [Bacillus subtilis]